MRKKVSLFLFLWGLILAVLPLTGNRSFSMKPETLINQVLDPGLTYSVDEIAKLIVNEDSTIRLIDLRPHEEYSKANIPGSVNVPYEQFISEDPDMYLNEREIKVILYSSDDYDSNYTLVYCRGLGYDNAYVMEGGLKEWTATIMGSRFTGSRITARENAIYEVRAKASRIYNEINALPDSLRAGRLTSAKFSARKLDGGCE